MPDDMESELLFHEEVFVVSGMANPMANRRKLSLAKLIDQPWCLPSLETFPWTRIADAFQRNGLELPSRIVTNSLDHASNQHGGERQFSDHASWEHASL